MREKLRPVIFWLVEIRASQSYWLPISQGGVHYTGYHAEKKARNLRRRHPAWAEMRVRKYIQDQPAVEVVG